MRPLVWVVMVKAQGGGISAKVRAEAWGWGSHDRPERTLRRLFGSGKSAATDSGQRDHNGKQYSRKMKIMSGNYAAYLYQCYVYLRRNEWTRAGHSSIFSGGRFLKGFGHMA